MLYPAELRAHKKQISRDFDYIGNAGIDEGKVAARSPYSKHLTSRTKYSFLTLCMSLWHRSCLCEFQRKSFSPLAIPTLSRRTRSSYFQGLEIGKSSATLIGRRSGAQRGALEDKLRPEVFLDAPCISLQLDFTWPTRALPQALDLSPGLRQHKFFLYIQSSLPQQSRNHRLFEA